MLTCIFNIVETNKELTKKLTNTEKHVKKESEVLSARVNFKLSKVEIWKLLPNETIFFLDCNIF